MISFENFENAHADQLAKNKQQREKYRKKVISDKLLRKISPTDSKNPVAKKVASIAAESVVMAEREKTQQKWTTRKKIREMQEKATIDELTGVYNRHGYEQYLSKKQQAIYKENEAIKRGEVTTEKREKKFSMIVIDLDKFKEINDTYGHTAGDMILQEVAHAIEGSLRGTRDIVVRMGGDEFMAIVEDDSDNAPKIAERIRRAIANIVILYNNKELTITASIGVAPYNENADEMHNIADKALYVAKGEDQIYNEELLLANDAPKKTDARDQVWYFDPATKKYTKYIGE